MNVVWTLLLAMAMAATASANVVQDCLPDADASAQHACDTFVEGFLAGALLTDAAIIESLEKSEEGSGFMARAYRTRLGKSTAPATYFASFCLPDKTLQALVAEIRADMSDLDPARPLGEVVYSVIKQRYPCPE